MNNLLIVSPALACLLFLALVVFLDLGFRIGRRQNRAPGSSSRLGVVEGATLGLLGLILAFTYAGADARLTQRRQQIVQEANAIRTAYLSLDMLPETERSSLQDLIKRYLAFRIDAFRQLPDEIAARQSLSSANSLEYQIWREVQSASKKFPDQARWLIPPIHSMFEIATTREMSTHVHTPVIVFVLLVCVSLLCSLVAGFSMSDVAYRNYFHMAIYSAIVTFTIYVIVDMEFPRTGIIREEQTDCALIQLLEKFHAQPDKDDARPFVLEKLND